jgi:Predicted outer membrane protein
MKKHNKFLSLFLALVMLMTFAVPLAANAAPIDDDGTITITPPTGHSLNADYFEAYELFELTSIIGTGEGAQYVYEPTAAVTTFLAVSGMAGKYGANGLTGAAAAEAFRLWLQDSARTENEIIQLAKDLIANVSILTAVNRDNVSKTSEGEILFENLNYGYYLVTGESKVVDANGDHNKNVISRGMLINVPNERGEHEVKIALKADAPKIEKDVWFHDKAGTGNSYDGTSAPVNGSDAGWQNWTDVNIGDDVYFKLTATVPDMEGYEKYTFIVHDTLSKGITYNPATADIKIQLVKNLENPVPLTKDTHYTVAAPAASTESGDSEYADGTKFEITFIDFEDWIEYKGWTVEIIYKAKLNENAIIGKPGNPNKVKLEYSNNPNWKDDGSKGPTGETPEDEARVYTYDIEIYKYTGDIEDEHVPLQGAEFQLRVSGTNKIIYVIPDTTDGYDYRVVSDKERTDDLDLPADERLTTDVLVSGTDGKIKIKGLDAGKYELKETKSPAGYNQIPGWITDIVIEKNDESDNGYKLTFEGSPANSVNVLNNTGGQLPGTGGIGIYLFFGIGSAMAILLAAAFIIYRKRMALNTLDVG